MVGVQIVANPSRVGAALRRLYNTSQDKVFALGEGEMSYRSFQVNEKRAHCLAIIRTF